MSAATDLVPPSARDLLQTEDMVRRWVITVDALPRARLPQRARPVQRVPDQLVAGGAPDAPTLSPDNYARYEPYVALAESIDPQALVSAYRWLYPLFQQAYTEVVRPEGYFNDRLIEVIDHLLATPELPAEPQLSRPSVTYRLADPDLEALSAGRKALLRMGPDNARRVKAVLARLRAELSADSPARAGQGVQDDGCSRGRTKKAAGPCPPPSFVDASAEVTGSVRCAARTRSDPRCSSWPSCRARGAGRCSRS
ncbi:MAG TPA: DUF3014 domain-containing protein [Steroidobacteraceae bacterium]|nr:DUF3014 domain-containing protein [Steroidobacteraceae bacterium]